ncbi:MAG: flagellar biosynthesis anti-sigma factor FlgM [Treponema sp.]|nr:flagellar biosynthesis anti-sigma factor FlgM [Treponema sp.]
MMINNINVERVNALNNVQNTKRTGNAAKSTFGEDSVSISKEALAKADEFYMKQVAAETPDVRADRVAEVKAKLQDPNYLNNAVIASAADKIMESFGL